MFDCPNISLTPSIIVPKLIGMYNIKEYFNAGLLFISLNNAAINVLPLLLIPGTNAITWINPINNASFVVKSASFFLPLMSLTKNKKTAVIINEIPISKVEVPKTSSIKSLRINPTIPTGIQPRTIQTVNNDVENIHKTTEKITKRFDSINNVKIETDNIKSIED